MVRTRAGWGVAAALAVLPLCRGFVPCGLTGTARSRRPSPLVTECTVCADAQVAEARSTSPGSSSGWSALESAMDSSNGTHVRELLRSMREEGDLRLFNSTVMFYRRMDVGQMMMATGLRGDVTDKLGLNGRRDIDRVAAILGALVIASFLSSTTLIQAIPGPDIVRFSASWLVAFTPYAFLSLGLAKPALLQAGLVQLFRLNRRYRERLVRHEAGHFLTGYLCGMPVESYRADSVTNAVSFFPLETYGAYDSDEGGGITEDDLLRLGVVSLGGVVAETMEFGNSEGGYADLMQLQDLLSLSQKKLSGREQRDRTRFAAVMAHTYLTTHRAALRALMDAFLRRESVVQCIRVIEEAGKDP